MKKKTLLYSVILLSFCAMAKAQEAVELPGFYIKVDEGNTLAQKLKISQTHAEKLQQRRFWFGCQFDLREDVNFYDIYIYDDGGISISRGGGFYLREDDDLKTHALHSLSGLGDKDAEKELKDRMKRFIRDEMTEWGVFFLLDVKTLQPEKIKLFSFRGERKFKDFPVFWGTKISTAASFDYLKQVVEDKNSRERTADPAVFVISLHDDPQVIPFLSKTAGGDMPLEIRKDAAFWLGQIPREETFDELLKLYNHEKSREMKEKLIFAISQHESERSTGQLIKIAKTDGDFELREKAIFWLGQNDDEKTLDILNDMLDETDSRELKEKIVFSISQHKSERAAEVLIEKAQSERDPEVRKKMIFWLGQMAGKRTLDALGDIVENDAETEVKTKAVFAISQHSDREESMDLLIDIAKNNPNPQVRKKAIFWLSQTGDVRALAFLKDILTQ